MKLLCQRGAGPAPDSGGGAPSPVKPPPPSVLSTSGRICSGIAAAPSSTGFLPFLSTSAVYASSTGHRTVGPWRPRQQPHQGAIPSAAPRAPAAVSGARPCGVSRRNIHDTAPTSSTGTECPPGKGTPLGPTARVPVAASVRPPALPPAAAPDRRRARAAPRRVQPRGSVRARAGGPRAPGESDTPSNNIFFIRFVSV